MQTDTESGMPVFRRNEEEPDGACRPAPVARLEPFEGYLTFSTIGSFG